MINIVKGDITQLDVEAVVNAANAGLRGGGGVDGAIHRAGGPVIQDECEKIRARQGGCPTGEAVITSGGRLKAKYVIHTVGPIWHGGGNDEAWLLASAYRNSLALAVRHKIRTIAFPNISTGIYGFPKEQAAEIAVNQVRLFLEQEHPPLDEVIFCCFDEENYRIYQHLFAESI